MATAANPLVSGSPSLKATIMGVRPSSAELQQIIAFEQQGEDSDSKNYLAATIPMLVLPHPKSGIPCSASGNLGSSIGNLMQSGASLTGPGAPFVAIGGELTSLLSGVFGGPSGEQKSEAPILCNGYLQMNETLQRLDESFQLGQVTLPQYTAELDILQQQWNNLVAPVNQPNSASDRYTRIVDALVRLRKSIATQMVSATATPTPTNASGGVNVFGFMIPTFALLILAIIFLIGVFT